jgi:hypothetical protein
VSELLLRGESMTLVKFVANISTQGDKLIIIIPKAFHEKVEPLRDIQVKVSLEEAV